MAGASISYMETSSCSKYLSNGKGFEAKIKVSPEHFIVDELSSFDRNVEPDVSNHEPTNESASSILKRTTVVGNESIPEKRQRSSDGNDIGQDVTKSCWDDVDLCKRRLEELLGSEAHANLQTFAQQAEAEIYKPTKKAELIKIGTFSDRGVRTFVHRSIRLIYPFLKSVTTPNTGEVSVRSCPNYWKFLELLGHDMSSKIFKFIHIEALEKKAEEMTVEGEYTKEERRKIHHLIGSCFGKFMETRTLSSPEDDNAHIIAIRRKPHQMERDKHPTEMDGKITAFTLWKRNCETYAAIHHIGRYFNIPHNMFNFAGIKDKRAVTTQRCTVIGFLPEKFEKLCKSLPRFLKVSDCRQVSRTIRLGELDGNRFCIKLVRIRDLQPTEEKSSLLQDIQSTVEDVKVTGFINYFGPQRFGRHVLECARDYALPLTLEAPAIGLAMLQNDFKMAVEILLSPTKGPTTESDVNTAKKHFLETHDIDETLKLMPPYKLRELSVLRTLKRMGGIDNDTCAKALLGLPYSTRLLYVHSVSSYLWNEMATERIRKFGNKVVEGDLVRISTASANSKLNKIISVTAEAVAENLYTLKDVVLPAPGNQVCYPTCLKKEYMEILEKFSVNSSNIFRITALKIYAPGTYRKLVETPANLSMKIIPHGDSSEVRNLKRETASAQEGTASHAPAGEEVSLDNAQLNVAVDSVENYEKFDIELSFDLSPSCYATTFLSELTKGHLK